MCFWLVETNFSRGTTNQNHYQDLSSDTSSVWNFCARSTEVISRGNQRVSSWNVGRFLRLLKNPFLFLLVSAPACLNKICLFPHASSADWYTYTSLKRDYNVRSRHFPLGYHFFSYLFPRLSQFFVGSLPCSERFFPGYFSFPNANSTGNSRRKANTPHNRYYHSKQIFLPFHWPRVLHVTCK